MSRNKNLFSNPAKGVHQGHKARKRFGQNFLHDEHVIEGIVRAIGPKEGENLLEIGPGLGAITEPVAELTDMTSRYHDHHQ